MAKNILIAEDETPMAKIMAEKLKVKGYVPTIAKNGKEALDLISKNNFDLILLDLIMPILDGFEFLKQYSQKKLNIPVIVMSNLNQDEDVNKAKKLGAADFLVKSDTSLDNMISKIDFMIKK